MQQKKSKSPICLYNSTDKHENDNSGQFSYNINKNLQYNDK